MKESAPFSESPVNPVVYLLYYNVNGSPVPTTTFHKDLGVYISSDLSWSGHIEKIVSKAYRSLGMVRRHFSASISANTKRALYIYLIRSQLLYCSVVWRPFHLKDIHLLERVQRRATKYILNNYSLDYKSRLVALDLLPLAMVNDISFFVKSVGNPTLSFDIQQFISFSHLSRHSSNSRLIYNYSRLNLVRHFYFNRLPRLWNSLPPMDQNLTVAQVISRIKAYFWDKFLTSFNPKDPCSLHLVCPCDRCHHSNPAPQF